MISIVLGGTVAEVDGRRTYGGRYRYDDDVDGGMEGEPCDYEKCHSHYAADDGGR